MHWYFLIFSYKLTVSNGLSLVTLKREVFTLCSGSFEWGVHLPLVSICFLYALLFPYKLTISNGLSFVTLNSEEFTWCSGSFEWGGILSDLPG